MCHISILGREGGGAFELQLWVLAANLYIPVQQNKVFQAMTKPNCRLEFVYTELALPSVDLKYIIFVLILVFLFGDYRGIFPNTLNNIDVGSYCNFDMYYHLQDEHLSGSRWSLIICSYKPFFY